MVLVKNVKFLHPFFLGKIGLEKLFGAILDRKEAILDYNNINLTRSCTIDIFPRGLASGFGQKFEISWLFLFRQNRLKKSVCAVLERKQAI